MPLILYALAVGFCLMALVVAASGNPWLGLGFVLVEVAAVVLTRTAGLNAARRLAERRRRDLEEQEAALDSSIEGSLEMAEPAID